MDNGHRTVSERFADIDLMTDALRRAVGEALLRHKKLGHPICVWRDGKVVELSAQELRESSL